MRLLIHTLLFLLLVTAVLPCAPVLATEAPVQNVDVSAHQAVLNVQKSLLWQRINAARKDPRAVLYRLGISDNQARTALGDEAWILDVGLPPLAWDSQLHQAATAHGRDMLNRIYYSHIAPEGTGPMERIAATGYQAVAEDESLGALVFTNYVEMETAVAFLLDTLLRDELTAAPGSKRMIFSPIFTEVGVSLSAETVTLLADQPYIYLLVIDYAQPMVPRAFILGTVQTNHRVAMKSYTKDNWDPVQVLPGGAFQVPYPTYGAEFVAVDEHENVVQNVIVYDFTQSLNRAIDLSLGAVSP